MGMVIEEKTKGYKMMNDGTVVPFGPEFGPLVEWTNGRHCNVYDGDVVLLPEESKEEQEARHNAERLAMKQERWEDMLWEECPSDCTKHAHGDGFPEE